LFGTVNGYNGEGRRAGCSLKWGVEGSGSEGAGVGKRRPNVDAGETDTVLQERTLEGDRKKIMARNTTKKVGIRRG